MRQTDPYIDRKALEHAGEVYGLPVGVDDSTLRGSLAYQQEALRLHCRDLGAALIGLLADALTWFGRKVGPPRA